jgi:lipopolysaccharide/colanic/teichoic acid biosynthesis glycosyltransferase
MDMVLSSIGLLLFTPLLPFIALAIKLNSKGPVFFHQTRIGRTEGDHTHLFNMIKLRTMVNDAEKKTGAVWAVKNDPRVTSVGMFLRKTRLDEFPQLINVLMGDMSIIGPRPERPGLYGKLEKEIPYFAERTYNVVPGITGLAQVSQGYDTCIEDVRSKLTFDHSYALNLTSITLWLKMDLFISIKTLRIMVTAQGQ